MLDLPSFLVMRVGALRCALPVSAVVETMRPLAVKPLGKAPGFVTGVAIIRGEPMPVLDLARILGGFEQKPSRLVVVNSGEHKVALAVEAVVGIHQAARESFADAPPLLARTNADMLDGLGALDGELLLLLQTARLIPDEVWALIAEREVA